MGFPKPTFSLNCCRATRLLKDSRNALHSFSESDPLCGQRQHRYAEINDWYYCPSLARGVSSANGAPRHCGPVRGLGGGSAWVSPAKRGVSHRKKWQCSSQSPSHCRNVMCHWSTSVYCFAHRGKKMFAEKLVWISIFKLEYVLCNQAVNIKLSVSTHIENKAFLVVLSCFIDPQLVDKAWTSFLRPVTLWKFFSAPKDQFPIFFSPGLTAYSPRTDIWVSQFEAIFTGRFFFKLNLQVSQIAITKLVLWSRRCTTLSLSRISRETLLYSSLIRLSRLTDKKAGWL